MSSHDDRRDHGDHDDHGELVEDGDRRDATGEYSATVLGSHWFTGPAPGARPDRVEGSVLRFGPGVTAQATVPFPVPFPEQGAYGPAPAPGRRRGLRRYALAAAVLAAVLLYLGWQRYGPGVEVRDLAVTTGPGGPACDSAADVTAVVGTNGRPGNIRYEWVRSDGTRSGPLTERVTGGQTEARVHLLWTFRGRGTLAARAEIRILEPRPRSAAVDFTYRCP
ncbi:hypothetical protein [Streptomyces sp. NPDC089799]|uniref:hypothetical protein n=1 Tax=Streptomyces sp. NPDC089799 TaxID=3155066 RepID=UPI003423B26E